MCTTGLTAPDDAAVSVDIAHVCNHFAFTKVTTLITRLGSLDPAPYVLDGQQLTEPTSIVMQRTATALLQLTACLLLALGLSAQAADKNDPTGTWTWSVPGRDGNTREVTAKLKLDGDKLTGSISGRQNDTNIEDGKLSGDQISFKVTREFNGNKIVQKFSGKIAGDSIKGKIESEREGQPTSRDWDAKRAAK